MPSLLCILEPTRTGDRSLACVSPEGAGIWLARHDLYQATIGRSVRYFGEAAHVLDTDTDEERPLSEEERSGLEAARASEKKRLAPKWNALSDERLSPAKLYERIKGSSLYQNTLTVDDGSFHFAELRFAAHPTFKGSHVLAGRVHFRAQGILVRRAFRGTRLHHAAAITTPTALTEAVTITINKHRLLLTGTGRCPFHGALEVPGHTPGEPYPCCGGHASHKEVRFL